MSASSEVHDPEPFVMSAPSVAFLLHFQQTIYTSYYFASFLFKYLY